MSEADDAPVRHRGAIDASRSPLLTAADFADRRAASARPGAPRHEERARTRERRRPGWRSAERPWWLQVNYVTREMLLRGDAERHDD